jgi:hypothetical protein
MGAADMNVLLTSMPPAHSRRLQLVGWFGQVMGSYRSAVCCSCWNIVVGLLQAALGLCVSPDASHAC